MAIKRLTMILIINGKEATHKATGIARSDSLNSDITKWEEEKGDNIITDPEAGNNYGYHGAARTTVEAYERMLNVAKKNYPNSKIEIKLGHKDIK